MELEFVECSMCASKPGSPTLCESCLLNRSTIGQLKQRIKELEEGIEAGEYLIEERNRVLRAIPECEVHGDQCVPHAIEWIERIKTFGEVIFHNKRHERGRKPASRC